MGVNWDFKEAEAESYYARKGRYEDWFERNESDLQEQFLELWPFCDLADQKDYQEFLKWAGNQYEE